MAAALFTLTSAAGALDGAPHGGLRIARSSGVQGLPGSQLPAGLPFPYEGAAHLELDRAGRAARISVRAPGGPGTELEIGDPLNATVESRPDGRSNVWALDAPSRELLRIDPDGSVRRFRVGRHRLRDPLGLAIDSDRRWLFVLDAAGPTLVRIDLGADGSARLGGGNRVEAALPQGLADARGLAFDPATRHLYTVSAPDQRVYELNEHGQLWGAHDVKSLELIEPRALLVAASADRTDPDTQTSLYLAGTHAGTPDAMVTEISLRGPAVFAATSPVSGGASLVNVIDASAFVPPSPDSAGIAYLAPTNSLLVSDSEVNEIPSLFTGDNLFDMTLSGTLFDTRTTSPAFSNEPTGVAVDPANQHCFFSDDDANKIFEVDPGLDTLCGTPDDVVTSFSTTHFASFDPEGVAFGFGDLFVVDGVNAEVYRITPNGSFDGVPPEGDDTYTSFDTAALGILDPEGIEFDPVSGDLYLVGPGNEFVVHTTAQGSLIRTIDISFANVDKPAGLALAPSSIAPSETNLYMAARGDDNNSNPTENDGMIFEFSLPFLTPGNQPPTVSVGPAQAISFSADATLPGVVMDDGIPGSLTITWSQVSGPAPVFFADPSAAATTASFTTFGNYVLRLTADDGELLAFAEVGITVQGPAGAMVFERRVGTTTDDAEERPSGSVNLTSSDLELVFDAGTGNQIVGLRFDQVDIPPGTVIQSAAIQFQVDETAVDPAALTIEGEAAPHAAPFLATSQNVSSRPRTASSAAWAPPPWTSVEEAGFDQQTPDITPIIQEIVDGVGWASGNALAIIISGTGVRIAESFDGVAAAAPLLHIQYVNAAPTVDISAPADLSSFTEGTSIGFAGTADDLEDGDLTPNLSWSSDLDGVIGTGGSFNAILSLGTHVVTAAVTDGNGLPGDAQVSVSVNVNAPPSVMITAPTDLASFTEGTSIAFAGTASDAEDGDLTASLAWTSDLDGAIGTAGSFNAVLSVGTHVITASVVDAGALPGQAQVSVTVDPNTPPVVMITAPLDLSSFVSRASISFAGTAFDAEEGDVTASLSWSSDLDGVIGVGGSFSATLKAGSHVITAVAIDGQGLPGDAAISLTVTQSSPVYCGLGIELAAILPVLAWWRRRIPAIRRRNPR